MLVARTMFPTNVGRASSHSYDARRPSPRDDRAMNVHRKGSNGHDGRGSAQAPAAPAGDQAPAAPAGAGAGPAELSSARAISRRRLVLVDVLITITTLLGVVAILSVWANRLLLNPDNWSQTSTQLLQNSKIRDATANYLVDQLYANVNVAGALTAGLPAQLDSLAGPVAGALRAPAVKALDLALQRPRVQDLWTAANRVADQALVAVVEGGKGAVGVKQGVVTLDLHSVVNDAAARLGLPAGLGAKLPPSVGNLTVLKSNQLKVVQNVGNAIKGLALWLTILVPLLYGLAILLARGHRRQTLRTVGFAIVAAGAVAFLARSILESQITNSLVHDASIRPAVDATIAIGTSMITEIAGAFVFVGVFVIGAAWFAGRTGPAVAGRRVLAPYLRDQPVWSFLAAAGLMVLIFIWNPIPATGKPAGMIVFLLLALFGTEVLRRQVASECPDVQAGDQTASLRGRFHGNGQHGEIVPSASSESALVPEQLQRLATLRENGSITQAEYDSLKATLLH